MVVKPQHCLEVKTDQQSAQQKTHLLAEPNYIQPPAHGVWWKMRRDGLVESTNE
jgi:hypothetical protein